MANFNATMGTPVSLSDMTNFPTLAGLAVSLDVDWVNKANITSTSSASIATCTVNNTPQNSYLLIVPFSAPVSSVSSLSVSWLNQSDDAAADAITILYASIGIKTGSTWAEKDSYYEAAGNFQVNKLSNGYNTAPNAGQFPVTPNTYSGLDASKVRAGNVGMLLVVQQSSATALVQYRAYNMAVAVGGTENTSRLSRSRGRPGSLLAR